MQHYGEYVRQAVFEEQLALLLVDMSFYQNYSLYFIIDCINITAWACAWASPVLLNYVIGIPLHHIYCKIFCESSLYSTILNTNNRSRTLTIFYYLG